MKFYFKVKISQWLLQLLLFVIAGNLAAQTLKFKRLGLADGLSQNSVYSIVQDQTGFIWIATANGLNRYDGFHFKVYRYSPEKPEYSLQQNSIWTLALDGAGNLWVGLMSRGLNRIDATTGKVLHFQHQPDDSTTLSSNRIRVIYADDHGYVWVGTADAGLNRIDTRTLTVRRVSVSSPGNANGSSGVRIKAILNDRAAHLLIATDKALYRLNPRTLESAEIRLRAPKASGAFSLETVYLDRQGYLWLAPLEGGLWRSANRYRHWLDQQSPDSLAALPVAAWTPSETAAQALQNSTVKAMLEDGEGNLWVGSFTQGLFRITPNRKQIHQFLHHPFDSHSLSSNQIFSLMIDRSGLLWIGTNGGGVNILDNRLNRIQHFRLYDASPMGTNPSANLTRGKGGIGSSYSDADWVRAIRHGLNREGKALLIMPSPIFHKLSAQDLGALIAFLKQLPPVDNELPAKEVGPMPRIISIFNNEILPANDIDHTVSIQKVVEPGVTVAYGEYLANTCRGCHGPDLSGGLAIGPPGSPPSRNITPDATHGIGNWSEADFFRAVREGKRPNGEGLSDAMPRWAGKMTNDELRAIWLYLQSIEPVSKK